MQNITNTGFNNRYDSYIKKLKEDSFCVIPDFIDDTLVTQLLAEMDSLDHHAHFIEAGIGKGDSHHIQKRIRGDRIHWIDWNSPTSVQNDYLKILKEFQDEVKEAFYLPLSEMESFYSIYPPGTFYLRHYDNFQQENRRLVTCVLYLNRHWNPDLGGNLRLFRPVLSMEEKPGTDGMDSERFDIFEVNPYAGTLAVFITHLIPHEVLVAARERRALVTWLGSRR